MFNIGYRVAELRAKMDMNQEEFSYLIKTTRENLSRIENNRITPTIKTIMRICDVVGITIEQFFYPKEEVAENKELTILINHLRKLNENQIRYLSRFIQSIL